MALNEALIRSAKVLFADDSTAEYDLYTKAENVEWNSDSELYRSTLKDSSENGYPYNSDDLQEGIIKAALKDYDQDDAIQIIKEAIGNYSTDNYTYRADGKPYVDENGAWDSDQNGTPYAKYGMDLTSRLEEEKENRITGIIKVILGLLNENTQVTQLKDGFDKATRSTCSNNLINEASTLLTNLIAEVKYNETDAKDTYSDDYKDTYYDQYITATKNYNDINTAIDNDTYVVGATFRKTALQSVELEKNNLKGYSKLGDTSTPYTEFSKDKVLTASNETKTQFGTVENTLDKLYNYLITDGKDRNLSDISYTLLKLIYKVENNIALNKIEEQEIEDILNLKIIKEENERKWDARNINLQLDDDLFEEMSEAIFSDEAYQIMIDKHKFNTSSNNSNGLFSDDNFINYFEGDNHGVITNKDSMLSVYNVYFGDEDTVADNSFAKISDTFETS